MYPFVNKTARYPIGHPEIVTKDFDTIDNYFGLAKARVLPPNNLLHPILPRRSAGKLKFALCAKCADTQQLQPCRHNLLERSFIGTWTTIELQAAVQHGYEILQIFEVWHYKDSMQYDGKDKDSGLYSAYIDCFLKLKLEASGWPSWCKTEEDKDAFVRQCEEKEGFKLDPANMAFNSALRQLAKLCLNSFWYVSLLCT